MKGVLPWLVRWACHAGTRDFHSALASLVDPVQKIFFPHHTISIPLSPSLSKLAGSRAGSPVFYVSLVGSVN
jgi:hypothetical protein